MRSSKAGIRDSSRRNSSGLSRESSLDESDFRYSLCGQKGKLKTAYFEVECCTCRRTKADTNAIIAAVKLQLMKEMQNNKTFYQISCNLYSLVFSRFNQKSKRIIYENLSKF